MDRWINFAGDAWALIFAASFVFSITVGVAQHRRGKELWDTSLLPLIAGLHLAWAVPAALFFTGISVLRYWPLILIAVSAGAFWALLRRKARHNP